MFLAAVEIDKSAADYSDVRMGLENLYRLVESGLISQDKIVVSENKIILSNDAAQPVAGRRAPYVIRHLDRFDVLCRVERQHRIDLTGLVRNIDREIRKIL